MATGPEHYRRAEELAGFAENADADAPPDSVALMLQFAQVHATLALTAATVDAATWAAPNGLPAEEHNAWQEATT